MPVAKKNNIMTLSFTKEKETKGTWRYHEDGTTADAAVGTLYLKNHAVEKLGNPETLSVVITTTSVATEE